MKTNHKHLSLDRWIPVTEQLPIDDTDVLITHNGVIDIALFEDFREYGEGYRFIVDSLGAPAHWEPTHWMPLPLPPEE